MIYRFINLSIRLSSLGLKFLLVISLAKLMESSSVATYGLLLASVAFTSGVAGLEFSKYSNREIARSGSRGRFRLVRDQYVFFTLSFLLVTPVAGLAFVLGWIPADLIFWFYGITVLEYLSVEHGRTLVALNRQIPATVTLFLRNGAWVLVVLPILWLYPDSTDLYLVFQGWLVGALLACVYGFAVLAVKERPDAGGSGPIDWKWMQKGLCVALPLLVGTAAIKGLITFDRIVFFNLHGQEALAIYVIFIGIANVIKVFLDSGVFVFTYPKLIRYAAAGDSKRYFSTFREMSVHAVSVVTVIALVAVLGIDLLLSWIDRPTYTSRVDLFYYCLVSVFFYAVNMLVHYPVYSFDMDKVIIYSNLIGLAVFLVSAFLLSDYLGYSSVPVAMSLGYILMALVKLAALERDGWRSRIWHREASDMA